MKREGPDEGACDVLVVGAGLAGLTAAIAFAQAGFRVVSCGADERTARGRTVAMLDRSVAYLELLGVWSAIEPSARADARAETDRRHRHALPAPAGRVSQLGDRPRDLRLECRKRPDGRRASPAAQSGRRGWSESGRRSRRTSSPEKRRWRDLRTGAPSRPPSSSGPTAGRRTRAAPRDFPCARTAIRKAH